MRDIGSHIDSSTSGRNVENLSIIKKVAKKPNLTKSKK